MGVKFTRTTQGEMAVMPRAEYEELRRLASESEEDAGTARLVARARKEVADGEPLLPKETADRLANSENPVRVLREFRDYTQTELAEAAGITQGYLSDLESGKRKGPLELHQRIARALGVPLELLAPITVSMEEANPARFARRKQVIQRIRRQRGQS